MSISCSHCGAKLHLDRMQFADRLPLQVKCWNCSKTVKLGSPASADLDSASDARPDSAAAVGVKPPSKKKLDSPSANSADSLSKHPVDSASNHTVHSAGNHRADSPANQKVDSLSNQRVISASSRKVDPPSNQKTDLASVAALDSPSATKVDSRAAEGLSLIHIFLRAGSPRRGCGQQAGGDHADVGRRSRSEVHSGRGREARAADDHLGPTRRRSGRRGYRRHRRIVGEHVCVRGGTCASRICLLYTSRCV